MQVTCTFHMYMYASMNTEIVALTRVILDKGRGHVWVSDIKCCGEQKQNFQMKYILGATCSLKEYYEIFSSSHLNRLLS